MKIITISREFGSGGRELGKRLADELGIPYYDQQIIEMVAEKTGLDKTYIANSSEKELTVFYPSTIARGFSRPNYTMLPNVKAMASEQEFIKSLASAGDCVIVGRGADILLAEYKPFRIFVCADDESKLERCRERIYGDEELSDKDILRKCREIDKSRSAHRKMLTDKKWSEASAYELCVNTSGKEIKALVPVIARYIECWYTEAQK